MKKQRGFTLIELSIVLVIIGLLVGGVLAGNEMYQMAQARALMSQMDKYQAAVLTFQLKYNCKAGDCKNANALGLGPDGDGNKYVDGPLTNSSTGGCLAAPSDTCMTLNPTLSTEYITHRLVQGEQQYFAMHLANAGLIEGNYQTLALAGTAVAASDMPLYFPKDVLGKAYLHIFTWGGRVFMRTGLTELQAGNRAGNIATPTLNASQMQYIHSKFNDNIVIGANNYESLYQSNQRVQPLGIINHNAYIFHLHRATGAFATVGWNNACAISDGSGGYKYNIGNNGSCNLMWELDY